MKFKSGDKILILDNIAGSKIVLSGMIVSIVGIVSRKPIPIYLIEFEKNKDVDDFSVDYIDNHAILATDLAEVLYFD